MMIKHILFLFNRYSSFQMPCNDLIISSFDAFIPGSQSELSFEVGVSQLPGTLSEIL